ncbi:corticosteroid-binding globulin-like [Tachyglossus aculeatus]|uniref:corticosteroid-binding globulin-like n=1 Tax=Tachyglossus aculeatus TaxID=9261 RepID=UPI0018F6010C|nr:corticosteroid-binding globulin-like [Tachyglossus aculeatus]
MWRSLCQSLLAVIFFGVVISDLPVNPTDSPHSGSSPWEVRDLAVSNAHFALSFFKQLKALEPGKNVLVSPVSISIAFALLSLGARNTTLAQILEGFRFNATEGWAKAIHDGFCHLGLQVKASNTTLDLGSALFVDKNVKVLESFLTDAAKYYEAEAFPVNFGDLEGVRKQINEHVANQTHGNIPELFQQLNEDAVMISVSYIYFQGEWLKPFDIAHTTEDTFYVRENLTVKVPMMFRSATYKHLFDDQLPCVVLQLKYKGNVTAWFILPDEGKMEEVEAGLSRDTLKRWSTSFDESQLDVYLPKFSISGTYDLRPVLNKMGVRDLFSDRADLSGLSEEKLMLSKVVHKAVLHVDEKGTEAAGATGMEMVPVMLPPSMTFNRPFYIFIFEDITWSTLFLGKILNPTEV